MKISAEDLMGILAAGGGREPSNEFHHKSASAIKQLQRAIGLMWQCSKLDGVRVMVECGNKGAYGLGDKAAVHQSIHIDLYTVLTKEQTKKFSNSSLPIDKDLEMLKDMLQINHDYLQAQSEMLDESDDVLDIDEIEDIEDVEKPKE